MIVSDIYGCQGLANIELLNPDTIYFNYTLSDFNGQNISCNGFSDGSLNVDVTGGSGINFSSIIWRDSIGNLISPSNILNDTTLINLSAGTYYISVSDFNGCSSSSSVVLTEPEEMTNYFTTDSVTCNNGSDGSAYSNLSGGTAPYFYSWSTSSDSSSAHNLMANTDYQLSIQDNNGCALILDTIQVLQPDPISLTTILTLPSCNGVNDGEIIIDSISGATGGYSYLWSDLQTGTIITNLYGDIPDSINNCSEDVLFLVDTIFVVDADLTVITDYNGTDVECYGDTNANITAFVLVEMEFIHTYGVLQTEVAY